MGPHSKPFLFVETEIWSTLQSHQSVQLWTVHPQRGDWILWPICSSWCQFETIKFEWGGDHPRYNKVSIKLCQVYKILCQLAIDVRLLRSNININIVDLYLISFLSVTINDIYYQSVSLMLMLWDWEKVIKEWLTGTYLVQEKQGQHVRKKNDRTSLLKDWMTLKFGLLCLVWIYRMTYWSKNWTHCGPNQSRLVL